MHRLFSICKLHLV